MPNLFTHANPPKSKKVDIIDMDELQNRKSEEAKIDFCFFTYRNDVFNFFCRTNAYMFCTPNILSVSPNLSI